MTMTFPAIVMIHCTVLYNTDNYKDILSHILLLQTWYEILFYISMRKNSDIDFYEKHCDCFVDLFISVAL